MAQLIVGIGEYKVSSNPSDIIKTFALGSCVAVILYDKVRKIAGLLHVALPDSTVDKPKSLVLPGFFADTGLPLLVREFVQLGSNRNQSWIKLVGGATVMDPNGVFDIGKRNILAIRKILWKNNLGAIAEDVGGDYSRTVSVTVDTGEIKISSKDKIWSL